MGPVAKMECRLLRTGPWCPIWPPCRRRVPPEFDLTLRVGLQPRLRGHGHGVAAPQREGPARRPPPRDLGGADPGGQPARGGVHDSHGNFYHRVTLDPGTNCFRHDAIVAVSSRPDNHDMAGAEAHAPGDLPPAILRYTLPSRYCDSDKLVNFAWEKFGQVRARLAPRAGHQPVDPRQHRVPLHVGPRRTSRRGTSCTRGYGVCRDFAHLAVALNRTFNLPDALRDRPPSRHRLPRPGGPHGLPRLRRGVPRRPLVHDRRALPRAADRADHGLLRAGRGGRGLLDDLRRGDPHVFPGVGLPGRPRRRSASATRSTSRSASTTSGRSSWTRRCAPRRSGRGPT